MFAYIHLNKIGLIHFSQFFSITKNCFLFVYNEEIYSMIYIVCNVVIKPFINRNTEAFVLFALLLIKHVEHIFLLLLISPVYLLYARNSFSTVACCYTAATTVCH